MALPITNFVTNSKPCSPEEMSPGEDYVDTRWQFLCFSWRDLRVAAIARSSCSRTFFFVTHKPVSSLDPGPNTGIRGWRQHQIRYEKYALSIYLDRRSQVAGFVLAYFRTQHFFFSSIRLVAAWLSQLFCWRKQPFHKAFEDRPGSHVVRAIHPECQAPVFVQKLLPKHPSSAQSPSPWVQGTPFCWRKLRSENAAQACQNAGRFASILDGDNMFCWRNFIWGKDVLPAGVIDDQSYARVWIFV